MPGLLRSQGVILDGFGAHDYTFENHACGSSVLYLGL